MRLHTSWRTTASCMALNIVDKCSCRIIVCYLQARALIREGDIEQLLLADELTIMLRDKRAFSGWTEGHITFPPTFKYDTSIHCIHKQCACGRMGHLRVDCWVLTCNVTVPTPYHASECTAPGKTRRTTVWRMPNLGWTHCVPLCDTCIACT